MPIETIILSTLEGTSPQTDWGRGYIAFSLPSSIRTGSKYVVSSVSLENLRFGLDVDFDKTDYLLVEDKKADVKHVAVSIDIADNIKSFVVKLQEALVLSGVRYEVHPPVFQLENNTVILQVPRQWKQIRLSNNLRVNLGLDASVYGSGESAKSSRVPVLHAGLQPLCVAAPRLVSTVHSTHHPLALLRVIPEVDLTGEPFDRSFEGAGAAALSGSINEIGLHMCSPSFPQGIPLRPRPLFAVIRVERSFDA